MTPFTPVTGTPARLNLENVDTDQVIPARFMSRPRSEGYGGFLFHDLRTEDDAARLPDGTNILIAGRNFGCGSSREAAVYALVDFGIRAVLAPSFGDIFASNAINNGLLPARVPQEALDRIHGRVTVDLATAQILHDGGTTGFEIDPIWQTKLLKGWDDIDMTQQYRGAIATFRDARRATAPWGFP